MSLDQGSEGVFVSTLDEAAEELPIGQSRSLPYKHRFAEVLDGLGRPVVRHVPPSTDAIAGPSNSYLPQYSKLIQNFVDRALQTKQWPGLFWQPAAQSKDSGQVSVVPKHPVAGVVLVPAGTRIRRRHGVDSPF
jgi:hypothetical protein